MQFIYILKIFFLNYLNSTLSKKMTFLMVSADVIFYYNAIDMEQF